ncbi:MAG: hypothetical protein GF308_15475 [Candidatus Heimdallarchaeota archaeon]|nr:hypothetical protein [Candidatus Heimdallarchaeota archaeon]
MFATGAWTIPDAFQGNDEWLQRMVGVFLFTDDENREDPIQLVRWFTTTPQQEK